MSNSVGKNKVWLTATRIINLIFTMASAMILSRFRTLEEYGTYSQLLMVVTLITTLFAMGLPGSINYFLTRENEKKGKSIFLANYLTMSTIISFTTGIVLLIASPLIVSYFNNKLIKSFLYVLLLLPWINIITGSIDNVLVVYNRLKMLAAFRIINNGTTLLILILTVLLNWNFEQYMIFFIVSQVIFTIVVYIIIGNISGTFKPKINMNIIRNILNFSVPLGLASVVGTLHIQTDQLIIGRMVNTETLAIYSNASKEMPVTIISASISAVLLPMLVRFLKDRENKKAIDLWNYATTLSYILICFFVTILFIYAPQVISILYSDKYLPGVSIFRVYTLLLLLKVTYFGMILNALGKTKFIMFASIFALVLNVILNLLLLFLLGIIGSAIATFISTLVVLLIQLYYSSKVTEVSFKYIFPWKDVFIITIVNIIIGLIAITISKILNQFINIYSAIFIATCIVGLLYLIVMRKKISSCWKHLN